MPSTDKRCFVNMAQLQCNELAVLRCFRAEAAAAAADPRRVRHDFRIVKIAPDGKCMFRALASGMSFNAGYYIVGSEEEEADAGEAALPCRPLYSRQRAQRAENAVMMPPDIRHRALPPSTVLSKA